jgi:PAS domain S-box-containing protein
LTIAATANERYEALVQQSDALQTVIERLDCGVMVADAEGQLIFFNPAAETILGIGFAETMRHGPSSVAGWYFPDQISLLPHDQLPLIRAMRGETVVDELVFIRTFQQEGGVWVRFNGWPLKDAEGEISGGVVMFHNFTEGRQALQTLVLLSQVVEQTADSVVLTDMNGIIEYVNPAFETTTGHCKAQVLGETPRILKSGLHDAEFYRQMWAQVTQGLSFKGMVINRKKNGERYWTQQTITPLLDESGHLTHFVSVSQDITDLRKQQEHSFQLQLARDVQQRFYPAPPSISGFEIGASAHPADETGGDCFDFISLANGSWIIAVGDVKGHGFSSALVMALTRAYLRCFTALPIDLDEILVRMNQMLLADLEPGHFVTLSLARLDPFQKTISYASAGHVPAFLLHDSGDVKHTLDSTGPPLGLFPGSQFSVLPSIALSPGEMVVFLTDGITESTTPKGMQIGTQPVLHYVRSHRNNSAAAIAEGIFHTAREFAEWDPQDDDITSVIIKAKQAP